MKGPICNLCGRSTWVEIGGGITQNETEGIELYHPNIDARFGPMVDIICDLEVNDIPLHDEHAEKIKMMHFLQHLGCLRAKFILKDCFRVLKSHGSLFIMVTDMKWQFAKSLEMNMRYEWTVGIWGEQEHKYDFHKWGYTFESLKVALEEAGFINVQARGYYNEWDMMVEAYKP